MDQQSLNDAYFRFKSDPTAANFEELYAVAQPYYKRHRGKIRGYSGFDDTDALTGFDNSMFELCYRDVVYMNFERALNGRLKYRRLDLLREGYRRRKSDSFDALLEASAEEGASLPKAVRSDFDLEGEVLQKTEADRRQLIDSLADNINDLDPVTALIVTEFSNYKSVNALAKALGLHHEEVKRRLRRLSRRYDANRFGDYCDYLAV